MANRKSERRVIRAAAKGGAVGLFAALSIRLADKPLGLLVWILTAVSLGAIASVVHEVVFGREDAEEEHQASDPLPLMITTQQLEQSAVVFLDVPEVGEVEIALQPHWKNGGALRISGLLADEDVIVARLHVVDDALGEEY